jgi:hypothetical protein
VKTILTLAATLIPPVSAGGAMAAHTINGNYAVTISGSQGFNGSHCLVLGQGADLDNTYQGGFQVISTTLVVYLDITGSGEEPATLLFSGPARNGVVGKNFAFEYIQGGYRYDGGNAAFGKKGSC